MTKIDDSCLNELSPQICTTLDRMVISSTKRCRKEGMA